MKAVISAEHLLPRIHNETHHPFLHLVLLLVSCSNAFGDVWYVNGDNTVSGDGTSWSEAVKTIQEAIDLASDQDEIWIRASSNPYVAGTSKCDTILIEKSIGLFGGFAGSETAREQADPSVNITVVSGDIAAGVYDDTATIFFVDPGKNGEVILGGLVVTDAYNTDCTFTGGGTFLNSGRLVVEHCHYHNNFAEVWGGAIFSEQHTELELRHSAFSENHAIDLGGAIQAGGDLLVEDCEFQLNTTGLDKKTPKGRGGKGGAIQATATTTIANSNFDQNGGLTTSEGGAVFLEGPATISDSVFSDNSAQWGGTTTAGGALYLQAHLQVIENCVFVGNFAAPLWQEGLPAAGGAVFNLGNLIVRRSSFLDNQAFACDGCPDSPENSPGVAGGGAFAHVGVGNVWIANSIFEGNSAEYLSMTPDSDSGMNGGALAANGSHSAVINLQNCIFVDNTAHAYGGAIAAHQYDDEGAASIRVDNCTFVDNSSENSLGDTIHIDSGSPDCEVFNSIIRGSSSPLSGNVSVEYSNVQGGASGTGNIDAAPSFRNPSIGDYSLTASSRGVDEGSNALLPADGADVDGDSNFTETLPVDMRGSARVQELHDISCPSAVVDMGAYEYCSADWNDDGIVDFFDMNAYLSDFSKEDPIADLNCDSTFDFFDVQIFLAWYSRCG